MDYGLRKTIEALQVETKHNSLKKLCSNLLNHAMKNDFDEANLESLAEYIMHFDDIHLLSKYFPSFLLSFVTKKIPLKSIILSAKLEDCSYSKIISHVKNSVSLAMLSCHPDILQYALKYFEINNVAPFIAYEYNVNNYHVASKKKKIECCYEITDSQIVSCCHTFLRRLPNEFSNKWNWHIFFKNFSGNENKEIRWMVAECMAIISNMSEAQSNQLMSMFDLPCCDQYYLKQSSCENQVHITENSYTAPKSSNIVTIDEIALPVFNETNIYSGNLVPVKSTKNNLRSLALAVASGKAISLIGPVGSGKTSLVEYLAAITGRKGVAFKKVQLGDQTDSRLLLGSHQCTDVPGEFVWRPGVLTEAVQNGSWLLLEDIDSAALDVASTLSSLLERGSLCVPGYRDSLPVAPGFQLFLTQRTVISNIGYQKKISNSNTILQTHLIQINVEPLSKAELSEIVKTLYPTLKTICSRMIEVFMMFSGGSHETSLQSTEISSELKEGISTLKGSRLISTRDLLKWCARAVVDFDVSSPDSALKVLQDALDIFVSSVPLPEHRLELAKKVGTCLGVTETKTEFYFKNFKPEISLKTSTLDAGRAKLTRKEKSLDSGLTGSKPAVFSFTRQTACLLEKIACCIMYNEPVLLVGETGTGKTSSIQYIAQQTGHKLVVINMNQQSDSADLLGGFKPVDLKYVIKPIKNEYENLFRSLFNVKKNEKFLNHIETCYETENWSTLVGLMKQSHKAAMNRLKSKMNKDFALWTSLGNKLDKLEQQIKAASKLTFAFIEGSLVRAMQNGYWVLLDEINLASAEILECLAGLLEDKNDCIELLEKSDKVPIKKHPEFTLFACMNPATDYGKKDLPVGLRNRFTEFFIDELTQRSDLVQLIEDYLCHMNIDGNIIEAIFTFYHKIKKEAKLNLVDGSGNSPHYSLRTLCRALTLASKSRCGTVSRSLYEAFCVAFLTQLDRSSHPKVEDMILKAVVGKKSIKSVLNQMIPEPKIAGENYLLFEGHWIKQGKHEIVIQEGYVMTTTVKKNLRDIARIISQARLPVLLQGDTSVGKTSLINYIAKASGNFCLRINNHEHTDLQEYIGSYATDSSGKLIFKDGILVEAMKKGYWVILDELNLAPSDVLEALNRVLDDNRELFVPETQEVIKADPNFMLFATQNPPGLYGGRKMLSRAFRNRFVELHFDEIPKSELEIILHQRCHVPPSYSKKMVAVMAELQIRRRGSATVQGKDGFITLRDLFRWGNRFKFASQDSLTVNKFYDWDQHISDEGYLILAGKVRQANERAIIEEVIEKNFKRKVNPNNLFSLHANTSPVTKYILEGILNNKIDEFSHVVWTFNMRRLAVLVTKAFIFNEPVLLVGETGCGKTSICQILAKLNNNKLLSVNCHMHTESSDFLGGLRPVRQHKNDGKLFEWVDGPLVAAMEHGHMFLADEISLADDSVLERMNSLLESERQLVLAEKGIGSDSELAIIHAQKGFQFIGTMNPGGDYGKKELSPALRNRFTEIWCDSVTSKQDMLSILEKSVNKGISLGNQEDGTSGIGNSILLFTKWLMNSEVTKKFPFSIRDLLSWVHFINSAVDKAILEPPEAYVHGACMTFLDCFGSALTGHIEQSTLIMLRKTAVSFLLNQVKIESNDPLFQRMEQLNHTNCKFNYTTNNQRCGIHPFYIEEGPNKIHEVKDFTFTAPTTGVNTLRLLRGMQLNKAILLEGNPGVGKTSLVTALAKASGHNVVRINLSDQTDITDLFGTDLPDDNGSFIFKEGAFLTALINGDWILLDELNLAPQPVLEGLNSCLDHRGEIFVSELGRTFKIQEKTRLFACQNPLKQGGSRRGLPISFLNRFTQVYIDTLSQEDLNYIVKSQYSSLPKDILHKIVHFNCRVAQEITISQTWGHKGSPWEINLRDIQRWCEALIRDQNEGQDVSPGKYVEMLYVNRMRTTLDKEKMTQIYDEIFYPKYPRSNKNPVFHIDEMKIYIGDIALGRQYNKSYMNRRGFQTNLMVLRQQLRVLKAIALNVKMNWLTILVGPTGMGKSAVVQVLADLTGNELHVLPVTSAMDISDLLGGFEQVDYSKNIENIYENLEIITIETVRKIWVSDHSEYKRANELLNQLHEFKSLQVNFKNSVKDLEIIKNKLELLLRICKNMISLNKAESWEYNKLMSLINQINHLNAKISNLSALNIGGKFEWIDSLLVKALVKGSWLLFDNVNLTSAAVLDRLNGLLEPNGVLTIPERGEMQEIKPHPNFRIFFTMDPKYGEISRAMRNRGVEIFIIGPDDTNKSLTQSYVYLDVMALLSSAGLSKYHEIVVSLHELMASFVQGSERVTISHIIQAAYLLGQQLIRGIPLKTAIINSFTDIYIKPRCGTDFVSEVNRPLIEMKKLMYETLTTTLDSYAICDEIDITLNHTLAVKDLCSKSPYAIMKQISFPLIQEFKSNTANINNMLFTLFLSYQKCPINNSKLMNNIVKECSNNNEETLYLNDAAYAFFNELKHTNVMYKRFYPELYKMNNELIAMANKESLLMYSKLLEVIMKTSKINDFSAIDYSKAVFEKKMVDNFSEYPILNLCYSLINSLIELVDCMLCDLNTLDDGSTCYILQNFNWLLRFFKVCSLPIIETHKNKLPKLKESIVPILYVHGKWMLKYFLKYLSYALLNDHKACDRLAVLSKQLICESDKPVIHKIHKNLRKLYGQPKLFKNMEEYVLSCDKAYCYEKLTIDLNQPLKGQYDKLKILLPTNLCIALAVDVPNVDIKTEINSLVCNIKHENDDVDILILKLLPINSYIVQRLLNLLQVYLAQTVQKLSSGSLRSIENSSHYDLLLHAISCNNKSIAPTFLNVLKLILDLSTGAQYERISTICTTFWNEFYKMLIDSPATCPEPFLKFTFCSDSEMMLPVDNRKYSTNIPLMTFYIKQISMTPCDGEYFDVFAFEKISLMERLQYSQYLEAVSSVMWKNMSLLNTSASMKLIQDAQLQIFKYEELISYMVSSTSPQEADTINTAGNTLLAVEKLQKYFKEFDVFICEMLEESKKVYRQMVDFLTDRNSSNVKMHILIKQLSLKTSIIVLYSFSGISHVDHVEKNQLRAHYINEDIEMFNMLLNAYYWQGVVSGNVCDHRKIRNLSDISPNHYAPGTENREDLKKVHPHVAVLLDLKEKTAQSIEKYSSNFSFRPEEPTYTSFVQVCKQFIKTVLSSNTIKRIYSNLSNMCDLLVTDVRNLSDVLMNVSDVVKENKLWLYSAKSFYKNVESKYSEAFPDLAKPLLSSLSQTIYSVTAFNDFIKELSSKKMKSVSLQQIATDLVVYPNTGLLKTNKEAYLRRYLSAELLDILKNILPNDNSQSVEFDQQFKDVLKMNLLELEMYYKATHQVNGVFFTNVMNVISSLVDIWGKQQKSIEEQKESDEALYVTKSKCEDENEEQDNLDEIMEMFPSHIESDFSEFKAPTLEQKKQPATNVTKTKPLLTDDDVSFVYKWHSEFVKHVTCAEWLPKPKEDTNVDFVKPLVTRYSILGKIMNDSWDAVDLDMEGCLTPSLMVLLSFIKKNVQGQSSVSKIQDFYKSSWVSESSQCLPILLTVKQTTSQLLDQWPDFPTLKDIQVIVDRIMSFSITSPVSRFLTGLELLRDKIEEWNKNAHKENNMIDISLEVGQQIVNWRKLEMLHWKECLNNLFRKYESGAHKYWFYIFSVINFYLDAKSDEPASLERVIAVLKEFMEKSNLAEYEIRLDIIYTYHCHLVHYSPSSRRDELLSVLWNLYNYYAQFSDQVKAHITEKRAPIDKKLKEFVKICTWDRDLSYWSVKDTVDKAHKTLHKYTKEFEKILKESVSICLVENKKVESLQHKAKLDNENAYLIDINQFIASEQDIKKYLDQTEQFSIISGETSLLVKIPTLTYKARSLCKMIMAETKYTTLVQALNDFVTLIIETSVHLGSMEVDSSAPKEKQKSQAKNIVQLKRKSLADLFKTLAKIGLNYRAGLVAVAAQEPLFDFAIPPVDFDAALSYLNTKHSDASLSSLWCGCEKYFQRNIARHSSLSVALLTPHQDMGMNNIERCKGFAANLQKMTNVQKRNISEISRYLCELKKLNTTLKAISETCLNSNFLSHVFRELKILKDCYAHLVIVLNQFRVLLDSFPEKYIGPESQFEFDNLLFDSPMNHCFKNSEQWFKVRDKITSVLSSVERKRSTLHKFTNEMPQVLNKKFDIINFVSQTQIDFLTVAKKDLKKVLFEIDVLLVDNQLKIKTDIIENQTFHHPTLRSISDLSQYLNDIVNELDELSETQKSSVSLDSLDIRKNFESKAEDLIASVLLIIQSIYKKYNQTIVADTTEEDQNRNSDDKMCEENLCDQHLNRLLQDSLNGDIKMLHLQEVIKKINDLILFYLEHVTYLQTDQNEVKIVMSRLISIMEQMTLLVQYFITQEVAVHRVSCKMLSVLLKIFTDFSMKGFCKPIDIDTEDDESGEGPGKLSGGVGLGEGEGQKDVSDKIEDQDQLDDAFKPGEEKNDNDKDCKEEEKGVNMSDDFDSHLQDVDKKDGENESDEENDDADKQMGDTDNAAEKLDQQIWGSDEEDDEENKKDNNERGSGESTGEKELSAKEDSNKRDDGSDGKEKKKNADINSMDEPEVDDDHVDPYHGNADPLPEPEDFELPENMNDAMDDDESKNDNEGESESENPFDIDVMKENMPELDNPDKSQDKQDNDNGLSVSSDEEDIDVENIEENDKPNNNEKNEDDEMDKEDEKRDQENNGEENNENDETLDDKENNKNQEENQQNDSKIADKIENEDIPDPQSKHSADDPSLGEKAENAEMDFGSNDNVETNAPQKKDEETAPYEQAQEEVGEEKQQMGRSELDSSDRGHRGDKRAAADSRHSPEDLDNTQNKPGISDQNRTLGDTNERKHKKKRTLGIESEEAVDKEEDGTGHEGEKEADEYQHVQNEKSGDTQVLDTATKEQADQQPTIQKDEEESSEQLKEDDDIAMEVDEEQDIKTSEEIRPEKNVCKDKTKDKSGNKQDGDEKTAETSIELEGENIPTLTVQRGNDNTYHTRLEEINKLVEEQLSAAAYCALRGMWTRSGARPVASGSGGEDAEWRGVWARAGGAARALCESLRLVLEPTTRTRRAGDFRTGRAINMRRVIPYIASHYRKDRIWLRRTRPARRDYKIAIALDDSGSMAHNNSREMAFESLALVSQALNLLESGDLAILSFGEEPQLLHPFAEPFSEHSGGHVVGRMSFGQAKTRVARLLDFCTVMFEEQSVRSDAPIAKLLLIVSDGRCIFAEGETRVVQAVRRARQQGIFVVYVIIDNPDNKDSIMDIRRPLLDPSNNSLVGFVPYLDTFPFPFYVVLRDVSALPTIMGDALRQWFDLATNAS